MQESSHLKISKNGLINMEQNELDFLNSHKWGGSGIERCLFEFILNKIKPGSTILEIGAGYCSTLAFSKFYNLYSIEDNEAYVGFSGVNYIHAPVINGWYNREIVSQKLPEDYQLVFVDGPMGEGNRSGILNNLDLLKKDCVYIFHDTYREGEKTLALAFAEKLNKSITFYSEGDYWAVVE